MGSKATCAILMQCASLDQRIDKLSLGGQGDQTGLLSLEWLRDASDEEAREYLMSVEGEDEATPAACDWLCVVSHCLARLSQQPQCN